MVSAQQLFFSPHKGKYMQTPPGAKRNPPPGTGWAEEGGGGSSGPSQKPVCGSFRPVSRTRGWGPVSQPCSCDSSSCCLP